MHIMEDLPSATLSPFTMFQNVLITPNRNPIPIKHHTPFSLLPAPGNHTSVFCLYELAIPGHFIETESHNMWPSESGFCHLTPCFRDASMLLCVSEHRFPPGRSDIPSGTSLCGSAPQLRDTWAAANLQLSCTVLL